MLSLPPLQLDDGSIFDLITAAKHDPTRGRLITARPAVIAGYQEYAAAAPEVGYLLSSSLNADECEACRHAYESSTKPLEDMRTLLLGRAEAARCPFCGISESATLDHYLPKESHPAFAVYSLNLVPACCKCNNQKRQLVLDEATHVRLFLHPYFDIIPAEQFLTVRIRVSPTTIGVTFRIHKTPGMAEAVYAQLVSHFHRLKLADRYRLMSLDDLRGKARALGRRYGTAGDACRVKESLCEEAESVAAAFGVNHWRAVLYAGLAANDEFCNGGFRAVAEATQGILPILS